LENDAHSDENDSSQLGGWGFLEEFQRADHQEEHRPEPSKIGNSEKVILHEQEHYAEANQDKGPDERSAASTKVFLAHLSYRSLWKRAVPASIVSFLRQFRHKMP
jgi:hypothetical protein